MARLNGRITEAGEVVVTLDGSGNGTTAVGFKESFTSTPNILAQSREADAGTYSAASSSKTGFTFTVATSDITSQDITMAWFAMEKS